MELFNRTPFAAERVALHDREGRDLLVVIVKATFKLAQRGSLVPADAQVPVCMADVFYGEPASSSVRYESDICTQKLGTDVVVVGHAWSPRGKIAQTDVSLKVGRLNKTVRVFGDRLMKRVLGGATLPKPEPFESLPLRWERAFGGKDLSAENPKDHEQDERNPVGAGFIARKTRAVLDGMPAPNLEDPAKAYSGPGSRPQPAGFGFVARHWQPRRTLAGTYDEAWQKSRCPLPPSDFDQRYYNGAPADQIHTPHLRGGEPVELINASRPSLLKLTIPPVGPVVRMLIGEDPFTVPVVLDTLLIEPDEERIVLVWRGAHDVHGMLERVEGIQVSAEV